MYNFPTIKFYKCSINLEKNQKFHDTIGESVMETIIKNIVKLVLKHIISGLNLLTKNVFLFGQIQLFYVCYFPCNT